MKQRITLMCFIVLFATISFGQHTNVENPLKLQFPSNLKTLEAKNKMNNHGQALPKYKQNSQNKLLKSSQASKQKLDSIIDNSWNLDDSSYSPRNKTEFLYSAKGNLIQELYYQSDSNALWLADSKQVYTYDANENRLLEEVGYEIEDSSKLWISDDKTEFTYDANGNLTLETGYEPGDSSNMWLLDYKYEYTYDTKGNQTQAIEFYFSEFDSVWDALSKRENTYNASGNLTQEIISYSGHGYTTLTPEEKNVYTYNSSGNLTLKIEYMAGDSINLWLPDNKFEYTYNTKGNLAQELRFDGIDSIGNWLASEEKTVYTYDATGNVLQSISFNSWVPDSVGGEWVNNFSLKLTSNTNYTYSDLILPFYEVGEETEMLFKYMLTQIILSYNIGENVMVDFLKQNLYYTKIDLPVLSSDFANTESSKVYPNPVSRFLNISFTSTSNTATFDLFDIQGRKIVSKEISNNEQIDLGELQSGMYLYNLYFDNSKQSGKLIKQ